MIQNVGREVAVRPMDAVIKGVRHDATPDVEMWERFCVTSGRAVQHAGDRCMAHGAADSMCTTAVRPAQCAHPHLSPNHPYPHCSECGRDL